MREEKITVNRRPVDREFTDADCVTLNEGDFTVTTRNEEAVVGKQIKWHIDCHRTSSSAETRTK